jgi:hypothetical protein
MGSVRTNIVAVALVLFASTPCWAKPATYSAGPTFGAVVDNDTKEPIKGALVVALWDLEGGMEVGLVGTLTVLETVTDEMGKFNLPAWGPIAGPQKGFLDSQDPQVLIFKPGYTPERFDNGRTVAPGARKELEVHDSLLNGKTVRLKKYEGTQKGYSLKVALIEGELSDVLNGAGCRWKQIPKAIRFFDDERKRERAAGLNPQFGTPVERLLQKRGCGSTDVFTRAYQESN